MCQCNFQIDRLSNYQIIFMIIYNKRISGFLPHLLGANFFLFLLTSISISFTSCDESSVVGLDVQPANDLLNVAYLDTTTLITKTVKVDSLRTDESLIITADALLGMYIDPIFGTASASFYTQLRLPTNAPSFGTIPVVDSAVLSLVYDTTYYGKRLRAMQTVNVYEVSEDIKIENSYYSNNTVAYYPTALANFSFIPEPTKIVTVLNEPAKQRLRIPLDPNFWTAIISDPLKLTDNATFQAAMKGLYITTELTQGLLDNGNILHFKLADAQSKLTLYYHNSSDPNNDSLKYDLGLNSVGRFSHFTHDYSGVDASLHAQLSTSPPPQNETVFIQGMAGVKTDIEFPYIMNWIKSGLIAVNKAELVIKVDIGLTPNYQLDTFAAPTRLVLFGVNDDGTNYLLPDYSEGDSYFGGTYNSTTHEYRFNIARYIQQILTGKRKNNGLQLLASGGAINANRVVIGGGASSSAYRMKLNISYTKLQ